MIKLVRTDSPGRPPRLSHGSWTLRPATDLPANYTQTYASWGERHKIQDSRTNQLSPYRSNEVLSLNVSSPSQCRISSEAIYLSLKKKNTNRHTVVLSPTPPYDTPVSTDRDNAGRRGSTETEKGVARTWLWNWEWKNSQVQKHPNTTLKAAVQQTVATKTASPPPTPPIDLHPLSPTPSDSNDTARNRNNTDY